MALDMLHLVVGKTRTEKSIICATNFEGIEAARDHFDSPCFPTYQFVQHEKKWLLKTSTRSIQPRYAIYCRLKITRPQNCGLES
jgi:hypothetical protein